MNGPLLPAETVTNFHQPAGALFYAHTRNRPVIYRDIKPENILIYKADVYELLGNPQEAQKARKRAKPWGLVN